MKGIYIGTSGYDYPEWKEIFYPKELKRKDFLSYYSSIFNAVEINNTFYNMPTVERIQSLVERSEKKIVFSIKANRQLTHEINNNWDNISYEFLQTLNILIKNDLLSSVIFQFPQSFHYTPENRIYLAKLLKRFECVPSVVEFRHREWIRESVFDGLNKYNADIVFCDMPNMKYLPKSQNNFQLFDKYINKNFYLRLHGRYTDKWYDNNGINNGSERYTYEYSEEELVKFLPVITTMAKKSEVTQIFFNNHPKGYGAKNAKSLKSMLEKICPQIGI